MWRKFLLRRHRNVPWPSKLSTFDADADFEIKVTQAKVRVQRRITLGDATYGPPA